MAAPSENPPPAYSQAHEMQDPGEYMYPGDNNILIRPDPRSGKNQPPAPYGDISTNSWPPEGCYVPNVAQPYPQQPVQRQVIVVRQNNNNAGRNYIHWRLWISLAIVVIKIIVIGIVVGVIYN